jgi:signal transduction histidine kinase
LLTAYADTQAAIDAINRVKLDQKAGQHYRRAALRPHPATRDGARIGVAVDIADDGPGIPPEQQSRVFEPFFTTTGVGEGSGLGLDIVRRIVAGHRGDITVRSQPGATTFTVRLPVAAAV